MILWQLAFAVGGVFLLLGGWLAVERLVRRVSPPSPEDCDEVRRMHGCHHCRLGEVCAEKPQNQSEGSHLESRV